MSVFMKIRRSPALDSSLASSLAQTKVQNTRKLCAGVYVREESEYIVSARKDDAGASDSLNVLQKQDSTSSTSCVARNSEVPSDKAQIAKFWISHIGCPFSVGGTGPQSYDIYGLIARALWTVRGENPRECICRHKGDVLRLGREGNIRLVGPGDVVVFCVCNRCDGCHVGCMINQD